eukprot:11381852-Alexandrium_andersonii.AAC.1
MLLEQWHGLLEAVWFRRATAGIQRLHVVHGCVGSLVCTEKCMLCGTCDTASAGRPYWTLQIARGHA